MTIQGEPMPPGRIERLEARVDGDELRLLCITNREFFEKSPNSFTAEQSGGFDEHNAGKSNFNWAGSLSSATFVLGGCQAKLIMDDHDSRERVSFGLVLRLRDRALETRPNRKSTRLNSSHRP